MNGWLGGEINGWLFGW